MIINQPLVHKNSKTSKFPILKTSFCASPRRQQRSAARWPGKKALPRVVVVQLQTPPSEGSKETICSTTKVQC